MKSNKERIYIMVSILVILIITAISMSSSIKNRWTYWDDPAYVTENQDISLHQKSNFKRIWTEFYVGNYQPVTMMTYAFDYKFSKKKPRSYHVSNFNFHLINTLLVFVFFLMLSKRWELAGVVSLLFGVHPMHVESVAWVSGRKDLVYLMFFMAGLIFYLLYNRQNAKKYLWLVLSFFMFGLSALSKSAAVVFPVALVLLDWYQGHSVKDSRRWLEKAPFFLAALGFGILAIISQNAASGPVEDLEVYNVFDRIFLISYALVFYVVKSIVPYGLSAMHYYPEKSGAFLPFYYYLSPVVLAALGYGLYKVRFMRKEILFGAGLFMAGLILVLQFVPVGRAVAADRYTYFSYLGLFFIYGQLLVYVLDQTEGKLAKLKPVVLGLTALAVIGYSVQTYLRCPVWKNSITLFQDVIQKYPNNYHGHYTLGKAYHGIEDFDKAIEAYTSSIELNPEHVESWKNRAAAWWGAGDIQQTFNDFSKVVKLIPEDGEAWCNMGTVKLWLLQKEMACDDFFKARELGYERANLMLYRNCRDRMGIEDTPPPTQGKDDGGLIQPPS